MTLGTVNGVRVISAARVPWRDGDDPDVVTRCESRGLVLFDGGGKSDAIVVGGRAIIWERQGERFRAFDVGALDVPGELRELAGALRRIVLRLDDREVGGMLLGVVGVMTCAGHVLERRP